MKVKIFKWANVVMHVKGNIIMEKAFNDFYQRIELCEWKIPQDIIKSFRTADIVPCKNKEYNRVVFNIGANKYRLICGYKFGRNSVVLYVRFLGTHSEYDQIDVCLENMFK